jgi:hypothetical protein
MKFHPGLFRSRSVDNMINYFDYKNSCVLVINCKLAASDVSKLIIPV